MPPVIIFDALSGANRAVSSSALLLQLTLTVKTQFLKFFKMGQSDKKQVKLIHHQVFGNLDELKTAGNFQGNNSMITVPLL